VNFSPKSLRQIGVKTAPELTPDDIAAWHNMRAENPALYSPYFHPAYTQLVATLRTDVQIAILYEDGRPVVFLPFQGARSGKTGFTQPIGMPMTDYHGFICTSKTEFSPFEFLRSAGLGAFHYNTLIDHNHHLAPHTAHEQNATMMVLKDGADNWRAARDSSYRRHLKSHRRRIRKAEDTYGPRRFIYKSQDYKVFTQLMDWKRTKFQETGKYDVLSVNWTRDLLETLWRDGFNGLQCDMHALYFGDHLAAIDLGLSDGPVFHSWIVAYDNGVQSLAPGIQLLEGLIDASIDLGYEKLDLGAGIDGYKRHYASDPVTVSSGFLALRGPVGTLSRLYGATEKLGERGRLGSMGRLPGKFRRRYSQIAACDDSFSGRAKAMVDAVKTTAKLQS